MKEVKVTLYSPDEQLPANTYPVLAYCNTAGFEDCYVEPEVAWYNADNGKWHTMSGEPIINVNAWFNIPEL